MNLNQNPALLILSYTQHWTNLVRFLNIEVLALWKGLIICYAFTLLGIGFFELMFLSTSISAHLFVLHCSSVGLVSHFPLFCFITG